MTERDPNCLSRSRDYGADEIGVAKGGVRDPSPMLGSMKEPIVPGRGLRGIREAMPFVRLPHSPEGCLPVVPNDENQLKKM